MPPVASSPERRSERRKATENAEAALRIREQIESGNGSILAEGRGTGFQPVRPWRSERMAWKAMPRGQQASKSDARH